MRVYENDNFYIEATVEGSSGYSLIKYAQSPYPVDEPIQAVYTVIIMPESAKLICSDDEMDREVDLDRDTIDDDFDVKKLFQVHVCSEIF